jgi:FkbM family methyltransferase
LNDNNEDLILRGDTDKDFRPWRSCLGVQQIKGVVHVTPREPTGVLMEKVIHFTVRDASKLSAAQAEVIECARKLHNRWEIRIWSDPDPGQDNSEFLLKRYWSKINSGAQLADLLRLDIIYRFGGVYLDSDLKLLRPLDDLAESFDFFIASEDGYRLTNAAFGARKQSTVVRFLIDELLRVEPDWTLPPNLTTGPDFFAQHLRWRKDITVLPRESFYSYYPNYGEIDEQLRKNHRQSHGEHLWATSWKSLVPQSNIKKSDEDKSVSNASVISNAKVFAKKSIKQGAALAFKTWRRIQPFDQRYSPSPSPELVPFYHCSGELVVQTIHGFRIVVDGKDLSVTPELIFKGCYELAEENFLKRTVRGGDWVIDVGSNIGTISLLAAHMVGPFGRVFSFEPNPRATELMAKSLVMNWIHERVVQREVAVGSQRGTVPLTFVRERLGDGQVGRGVEGSTSVKSMETLGRERAAVLNVPCIRLDEEFPIDLPIKLLKIDVEGFEGDVLKGASRLLRGRCVDFIMVELLGEVAGIRWHENVQQVNKVIEYGYGVFTLNEGELLEQQDLAAAIRRGHRNIVLAAKDQYRPGHAFGPAGLRPVRLTAS